MAVNQTLMEAKHRSVNGLPESCGASVRRYQPPKRQLCREVKVMTSPSPGSPKQIGDCICPDCLASFITKEKVQQLTSDLDGGGMQPDGRSHQNGILALGCGAGLRYVAARAVHVVN